MKFDIFVFFENLLGKTFKVLLKFDKNNMYLRWRPLNSFHYTSLTSSSVSENSCRKMKKIYAQFFSKMVSFMR